MGKKKKTTSGSNRPRVKVWISSDVDEGVFGDGKWRLLCAIEREGSLSAAAEDLGMSYRKAWGDLKKAEERLKISLIERHRGGKDGGKTVLTLRGKQWLDAYTKFKAEIDESVAQAYSKYMGDLTE
ncbi:winged helix-turn-helix domain-containing protein [Candidatus Hydrogenedentota bacterium]